MKIEGIKHSVHDLGSFTKSSAKFCICYSKVRKIHIKQCFLWAIFVETVSMKNCHKSQLVTNNMKFLENRNYGKVVYLSQQFALCTRPYQQVGIHCKFAPNHPLLGTNVLAMYNKQKMYSPQPNPYAHMSLMITNEHLPAAHNSERGTINNPIFKDHSFIF